MENHTINNEKTIKWIFSYQNLDPNDQCRLLVFRSQHLQISFMVSHCHDLLSDRIEWLQQDKTECDAQPTNNGYSFMATSFAFLVKY